MYMEGKQIKGFEGYFIQEDGTIFSKKKTKVKKLKPQVATQNRKYHQVRLYNDNSPLYRGKKLGKLYYVHRLVYENFVGEIPEGITVDHIDGNQDNNHYTNLQLLTLSQNSSKFNALKKSELWGMRDKIIQMNKDGMSQKVLAQKYNCSPSHIWRVINGKRQTLRKGKWVYYDLLD